MSLKVDFIWTAADALLPMRNTDFISTAPLNFFSIRIMSLCPKKLFDTISLFKQIVLLQTLDETSTLRVALTANTRSNKDDCAAVYRHV